MEIINKKEDSTTFGNIYVGDVFKYKDNYYMRILSVRSSGAVYNAVDINSGVLAHIDLNVNVVNVPGAFNAK